MAQSVFGNGEKGRETRLAAQTANAAALTGLIWPRLAFMENLSDIEKYLMRPTMFK